MDDIINVEDIKHMKLLTKEELEKLNYYELCLYIGLLNEFKKKLEGGNEA